MDGIEKPESTTDLPEGRGKVVMLKQGIKSFTANGRKYIIEEDLPVSRYKVYLKYQLEAGFHMDFETLMTKLAELWELVNSMQFGDAAVLVHNMRMGITDINNAQVYAYKFCTLFMNRVDEDPRYYHHPTMMDKIADWEAEGIHSSFFIVFSARMTKGYLKLYKELSPLSSEE